MRRLVTGLLAGVICFGAVQAKTHTDKTFLMPRSHNENMAMEYTGWHKQYRKKNVDKWDGTFQATGFYQASTNDTDLGKYFGKYNNASGPDVSNPYADTIQDFIWVTDRAAAQSSPLNNERELLLDPRAMIYDVGDGAAPLVTSLWDVRGIFRPKQTSYGVIFDYHQKLDKLTKGLFLKVSVPVVHVKNDMNICYTGARLTQNIPGGTGTVSLANYLAGAYSITGTQCALTHARICGSDSTTGVADVDVVLGYNFLYKEHKHVNVNVAVTIPTSDTPDGVRLFEATLGYAGHWAVGLGVDSAFELWQQGKKSLEFVGAINYKYVLNATEKRTLGFKYPDAAGGDTDSFRLAGKRVPMGYYMVGGQVGRAGVFPLANVLTREVGVEPGSRVEAIADFAFNWGNFTFDLGYNLFAKEAESVTVKCWPNDTYALVHWDDDPFTSYDPTGGNLFAAGDRYTPEGQTNYRFWINRTELLEGDAATPVYVTHKILGGFTYAFDWKYPLMMGIGASWEFVQGSNAALDGYALWAKLGVTF